LKILLVEDSPQIRNNLKKFISEINGVKICGEEETSVSAINTLKIKKPEIVILDVELKDSNGFDVLQFIKKNRNFEKTVVIMFTNHTELYRGKALSGKADYFFDKTEELDKLLSTIKELAN
jgi:DNA-binding NarL/FixJ family response regulator